MINVSVIIPCWCASKTIRRAVDSVYSQTLRPSEVIIIDDASPDDTLTTIRSMLSDYPDGWLKVIKMEVNSGPGLARNAGWRQARYEWLAFLDSDDAWHPRKLEIQYSFLASNPEVVLCGHKSVVLNNLVFPELPMATRVLKINFWNMLFSNRLPTRSVLLNKNAISVYFNDTRFCEDLLLWLEVIIAGHPCYRIDLPLAACFRAEYSSGGFSGNLWRHEARELATWFYLYKKKYINFIVLGIAFLASLLKYVKRILVIGFGIR